MFIRNHPHTPLQHIREMCWPSMGWRRAFRYVRLRIVRLSDSTHNIALGLSLGVGIAFTPLLGGHWAQAALFSYLFRSNFLAAFVGTFVGNPWTYPIMWWGALKFGGLIFALFGVSAAQTLPADMNLGVVWDLLTHEPLRVFLPWCVGSLVLAVAAALVSYPVFYKLVQAAKTARKKTREHRLHALAKDITGQK